MAGRFVTPGENFFTMKFYGLTGMNYAQLGVVYGSASFQAQRRNEVVAPTIRESTSPDARIHA